MGENTKKADGSAARATEKEEFLSSLDEYADRHINSWADLYRMLLRYIHRYFSGPSKHNADFSLALMLAFVLALEDLPEEGDARVIAKRLNRILVMETERTGIEIVTSLPEKTPLPQSAAEVLSLVNALAATMQDSLSAGEGPDIDLDEPSPLTTSKGKVLH